MTTWVEADGSAEVEGPRPGSLEWRASLVLKVLAGLNAFGMILALIPGSIATSALEATAFHVASGVLAILYVVVARALDRRQDWAVAAARPLLLLLLVWGTFSFATALAAGVFRIPLTTLGASLALLGRADRRPLPRLSGHGGAVLVTSVALIATVLTVQPVFGWGGFFDVHERDLSASLAVDCGTPGAGPPERITIAYEWSWSGSTLLANEHDDVVIGWSGDDAEGRPLYVLGEIPRAEDEIQLGSSSGVSAAMASQAAGRWRGSLRWRMDLSARGIRPGRVEVVLMLAPERPRDPQPLNVGASYIHVGVWRNDTPTIACSW